jgi:hypothetical protein
MEWIRDVMADEEPEAVNVWMGKNCNCKADESNLKTDGYVWIIFLNRSRLGKEFFENIERDIYSEPKGIPYSEFLLNM